MFSRFLILFLVFLGSLFGEVDTGDWVHFESSMNSDTGEMIGVSFPSEPEVFELDVGSGLNFQAFRSTDKEGMTYTLSWFPKVKGIDIVQGLPFFIKLLETSPTKKLIGATWPEDEKQMQELTGRTGVSIYWATESGMFYGMVVFSLDQHLVYMLFEVEEPAYWIMDSLEEDSPEAQRIAHNWEKIGVFVDSLKVHSSLQTTVE